MSKYIHPTAVIYPNVILGKDVYIGAYCVIGAPAENLKTWGKDCFGVIIGDGAILHGHNTIDAGVERSTKIQKNTFLMKGVHVGHDAIIGKGSILAPKVCIGGYVELGKESNLGMGAIVHPRVTTGEGVMIGMGCIVTKKSVIHPYGKFVGSPAKCIGINSKKADGKITVSEYLKLQKEWNKKYTR